MEHMNDLFSIATNPGTEVLAWKLNDSIPELSGVATSFLEAVGVIDAEKHSNNIDNAEKHFQAVHEFWRNKDFVPLLHEVITTEEYVHLSGLANRYGLHTSFALQQSRVEFMRKDPSLKDILNETDPSVILRAAISILIRYWCVDNMMEEYFFNNIGLNALGLDISFAAATQETPLLSEGEKEMFFGLPENRAAGPTALVPQSKRRSRPTTMPLNHFSPIGQLVNDPSIKYLAQVIFRYPKLVLLAGELLKSLKDVEAPFLVPCQIMGFFWLDVYFLETMRERLFVDPHLLVMVKMFSDQLKREIIMDRLQHIHNSLLPELKTFLVFCGFDMGKPVDRIRCAFSIMMRYWGCLGVATRLSEKSGVRPWTKDGIQGIKFCDNFKDELIGEVLFIPVHHDYPADCNFMLTRWEEANETEINHLLDKEWRDVLTTFWDISDKGQIWGLCRKIGLDTRVNLVLKNDSDGKFCMIRVWGSSHQEGC